MSVYRIRRGVLASAVVVGLVGVALIAADSVSAAKPLTVCASGCGFTSIQEAIDSAASGATILIGAGSFNGPLIIDQDVTLIGAGATRTTIQGPGTVVTISQGVVTTIKGVTIMDGLISSSQSPGGIHNQGSLTLKDSSVIDNSGIGGPGAPGGILNEGTLTVSGSTITGNSGIDGGGIRNTGTATLNDSTVSGNTSDHGGGGIQNQGTLRLNNSTVTANTATPITPSGGGIGSCSGSLTLKNTTVSGNSPDDIVIVDC